LNDGIPKICDFGVSQTKETLSSSLHTQIGTFNWMAPEMMIENVNYNEKVDVWSFGMVLYELTTNTIPYQHCQNAFLIYDEVIKYNKTPPIPEGIEIHSTLRELMNQCWIWDPQQRPSFSQIVQTLRNSMDRILYPIKMGSK
jgi:serine/threonine protein kinase